MIRVNNDRITQLIQNDDVQEDSLIVYVQNDVSYTVKLSDIRPLIVGDIMAQVTAALESFAPGGVVTAVSSPVPAPAPTPSATPNVGGFVSTWSSSFASPARTMPTQATIANFLPATKGAFRFPAPWATQAARITDATDASGTGVTHAGYAYHRNINYHVGQSKLYAFVNCPKANGGGGPTLFSYDKTTRFVAKVAPIFDAADPRSDNTGELWWFSATEQFSLYCLNVLGNGTKIQKFNCDPGVSLTMAQRTTDIFDIRAQAGYSTHFIKQCSASNDGNIFAGTVQDSTYVPIGAFTFNRSTATFTYHAYTAGLPGGYDEAQISKDGRWLVIKANLVAEGVTIYNASGAGTAEDNYIVDLTGAIAPRTLTDTFGAGGHSDLGYRYYVASDNWDDINGVYHNSCYRLWDLETTAELRKENAPIIFEHPTLRAGVADHVSFSNAVVGAISTQFAMFSGVDTGRTGVPADSGAPLAYELFITRMDTTKDVVSLCPSMTYTSASGGGTTYDRFPHANLDITGRYAFWTSNCGTSRLDAFIVEVPYELLGAIAASAPAPAPAPGTSVVAATWENNAGITQSAGTGTSTTLTKTANYVTGDTVQTLADGGYFQFTVPTGSANDIQIGVRDGVTNYLWTFVGTYYEVRENLTYKTEGSVVAGDIFRITRTGTTIKYFKNAFVTPVYTSAIAAGTTIEGYVNFGAGTTSILDTVIGTP